MAQLTQVHKPVNSTGMPRVLFIHGLDGHERYTWMGKANDENTLWPRWVGEDTGCPVWLLGYGAATSRWKADAMALPRQATAVLECLSSEPRLLGGPLVLVGHSLGGLVIKAVLHQGMGQDVGRHEKLARTIKGIAFVGTPHFGSGLASLASSLLLMRANPQVSDLRLHDAHLENLNQQFQKIRGELDIRIRIFAETQPVRLPGLLGRLLPGVTVVSPSSSEAHIPGEVATPVEANHITIAKPTNRKEIVHTSLVTLIKEVEAAVQRDKESAKPARAPLSSDRYDAISPEQITSTPMHLVFAIYGVTLEGDTSVPVCGTVCLTTDSPDRLRHELKAISAAVRDDPLVPRAAKDQADTRTLQQLTQDPGTRGIVLRALAVTSFSAYLYYCTKGDFDLLPAVEREKRILVDPLVHRLSKKGEHFVQIHTKWLRATEYIASAAKEIQKDPQRAPEVPRPGASRYAVLEELASLVVSASCAHLGDVNNAAATELFQSLRTRIRYAENIVTGERHKRDLNPLP